MTTSENMQAALEIVRAQASVRPMTAEEIVAMAKSIAQGIDGMKGQALDEIAAAAPAMDPKKAIRESSIVCLECGKTFKILTKKHLSTHGLTPDEYRAKYGYKKGQALAAKALARERRKKMQDMRLWERRKAEKKGA
ncbi:MucR family transcriptional regulator [Fundidesulfovibrio butyratiphilus]